MTRVATSGNKAHGLTQFSDMTQAEFKQRMMARVQREETPTSTYQGECPACTRFPEVANLGKNTSWDWTQHGAVTPVKNQGQCGGCWSFGSAAGQGGPDHDRHQRQADAGLHGRHRRPEVLQPAGPEPRRADRRLRRGERHEVLEDQELVGNVVGREGLLPHCEGPGQVRPRQRRRALARVGVTNC